MKQKINKNEGNQTLGRQNERSWREIHVNGERNVRQTRNDAPMHG